MYALTKVLLKYNYIKEEIEEAVYIEENNNYGYAVACMHVHVHVAHACGICAPACMHAAFVHICWCMCSCMACSSHALTSIKCFITLKRIHYFIAAKQDLRRC